MTNKLIFDINKLENKLSIKISKNKTVLGLDTASRTGYCIAKTDSKKLIISIGFIDIDTKNIKDKVEKNKLRYNAIYEAFTNLIASNIDTLVVEDVYFGRNIYTVILLARIGAIAFTIGKQKQLKDIRWLTAIQARKKLGLKCNKKKQEVHAQFTKLIGTQIEDVDIVDAIILAINGLI